MKRYCIETVKGTWWRYNDMEDRHETYTEHEERVLVVLEASSAKKALESFCLNSGNKLDGSVRAKLLSSYSKNDQELIEQWLESKDIDSSTTYQKGQ